MEDIDEVEGDNEAEEEENDEEEDEDGEPEDGGEAQEPDPDVGESQDRTNKFSNKKKMTMVIPPLPPPKDTAHTTATSPSSPTQPPPPGSRARSVLNSSPADGPPATAATDADATATGAQPSSSAESPPPPSPMSRLRPSPRAEALTARLYDIVPTMAAPQSTSINALAVTPDMRYWLTGGSDGYVRKYDGRNTINGKQLLTVAQRHPFVDSVVKAGMLMSYWENEEPPGPSSGGSRSAAAAAAEERVLSPVYSLAVHSQALWSLSGLEGGGINLHSVRHDEGKRIHCLRENGHTNAVSVLALAPDEKSVLSGGWDKLILDWDLNNGQVMRRFEDRGGQISAIELRPSCGAPIPAEASEVVFKSETMWDNNSQPTASGVFVNGLDNGQFNEATAAPVDLGHGSPAHESLFGSPDGSLFGDNETMGAGAVRGDDDDDFSHDISRDMDMTLQDDVANQGGMDSANDFAMADAPSFVSEPRSSPPPFPPSRGPSHAQSVSAPTRGGAPLTQPENHHSSVPDYQFHSQHPQLNNAPPPNSLNTDLSPPQQFHSSQPSQPLPSIILTSAPGPPHADSTQTSESTFMSASIDGTIRVWDRRVRDPVARIGTRSGVPPWCMGACWSPDGNWIYAGRRNGTVEEFSLHRARNGWTPERTLKFPQGSGPVTAIRPMVNGRHLVCASHDILRLYDLRAPSAVKHSTVPFLIIPGPPRAGVISSLYIDSSSRFMISVAGTRGWEGTSTEVLVGYEIESIQ